MVRKILAVVLAGIVITALLIACGGAFDKTPDNSEMEAAVDVDIGNSAVVDEAAPTTDAMADVYQADEGVTVLKCIAGQPVGRLNQRNYDSSNLSARNVTTHEVSELRLWRDHGRTGEPLHRWIRG